MCAHEVRDTSSVPKPSELPTEAVLVPTQKLSQKVGNLIMLPHKILILAKNHIHFGASSPRMYSDKLQYDILSNILP